LKDAAGHAKHIGAGGARGVVWALVLICAGCGDLDSTEPFIESTCTTDKDCPSGHACIETWVEVPDPPAPTWPDGAMDATKTADADDEGDSPGDAAADASDITNESRLDHADEADISRETDALVDVAGDENGDRDVSDESRTDGDIATDVSLDVPDRAELGAEDAIDAFDAVSDGTATGDTAAPDALDSDGEGGDEGTQTPARRASMLMTTSDASDDMDASLDGGRSDDRDGNDTIPAPDVSVDQPKPPTHLERRRSCSTTCSNSRCQSGWECSSPEGLCVPFACGEAHPCEMAGTYCDPVLRVCRSAAGECANDNDCLLDDRVKLLAKAS
jgi:hypothetical protein